MAVQSHKRSDGELLLRDALCRCQTGIRTAGKRDAHTAIDARRLHVPAYDRSWNLPAIHWIANFSNRSRVAQMTMANRILAKSEIAASLEVLGAIASPSLGWLLWMSGWNET